MGKMITFMAISMGMMMMLYMAGLLNNEQGSTSSLLKITSNSTESKDKVALTGSGDSGSAESTSSFVAKILLTLAAAGGTALLGSLLGYKNIDLLIASAFAAVYIQFIMELNIIRQLVSNSVHPMIGWAVFGIPIGLGLLILVEWIRGKDG